jgi:group I intron endonuclease
MSHLEDARKHRLKIREYSQFGIIYKAVLNSDGRVYVGQTTRSLKERISEHGHKDLFYFHNAIQKHGIENFTWEIIDYADSQEDLDRKEEKWISYHRSNVKGLGFNLTSGGDHAVFTEESIKKMSEKMVGIKNHRYGKKWSDSMRAKIGISRKGMQNRNIALKCVETNKVYKNMLEASKDTGISYHQVDRLLKSGKKSQKFGVSFVKHGGLSSPI